MTTTTLDVLPKPRERIARLVAAFLEARSEETRRAYAESLTRFGRFIGEPTASEATAHLLRKGHGEANALAFEWRNRLTAEGLASGSVNRHMAALRSVVKLARMMGLVSWALEIPSLRTKRYKDTRGPNAEGIAKLLSQLHKYRRGGFSRAKLVRDNAIVRLLYERGLRTIEVVRLDVEDVDVEHNRVNVLGKARTDKEWLTLAPSTMAAISAWLKLRRTLPGALFTRVGRGRGGPGRLTRMGIYRIVRKLGEAAGVPVRPHGLRHAAITAALDKGFDVRKVQRFSRHVNLQTLLVYDDNRQDLGGEIARAIAKPV